MSQIRTRFNILVHTASELVKFFSAFICLFYIVYAIIFRTVFFLLPIRPDIDRNIFEMSDIKFNLLFLFILLTISWFISYKQKKLSIVNPFKLEKESLLTLFITSLLLAYFYTRSFSLLSTLSNQNVTTGILTLFFLFFLTQIIEFYLYYYPELHINTFKRYFSTIFNRHNLTFFKNGVSFVTIVIVLVMYSVFISVMVFHQSKLYENVLKENLFIVRVAPSKTTLAYKVALEGYNFGRVHDNRYQLYSSYGQINPEVWTDNKIEFIVPLSWKVGAVELWIERPNIRDESRTISSNIATLTVLNRWDFFPTENEEIFAKATKKILRVAYLDIWNSLVSKYTFLK